MDRLLCWGSSCVQGAFASQEQLWSGTATDATCLLFKSLPMVQFPGGANLLLGAASPRLLLQSHIHSHWPLFPQLWDESEQKASIWWLCPVLGKDEAREHCLGSSLQPLPRGVSRAFWRGWKWQHSCWLLCTPMQTDRSKRPPAWLLPWCSWG